MPRPLRIDYPGAVHHVMNRGADHQPTFLTDYDRRDFTGLWQEAVSRFGIVVLAYAWMGNHYHALVVSPDGQISETLRHIGHVYTQRFNRRHGRDGALFRGRFHSVVVDSNEYLKRVARYIERNPLEAGITSPETLAGYEWSSLHHYLHPDVDDWVTTAPLLDELGSRHAYLSYALSDHPDPELEEFYREERHPRVVLGKQAFVNSLPKDVRGLGPLAGIPELSLDELDHAILTVTGPFDESSRKIAVELGQRLSRATRRQLAERYGFPSDGAVSQAILTAKKSKEIAQLKHEVLWYLDRCD